MQIETRELEPGRWEARIRVPEQNDRPSYDYTCGQNHPSEQDAGFHALLFLSRLLWPVRSEQAEHIGAMSPWGVWQQQIPVV